MAEDIVTRLRSGIFRTVDNREAADEIERLRAERDALRATLRTTYRRDGEELERLRALNKELQKALRFILAFYEPGANRYLDTEAWKRAEAGGRAVLKKCQEGSDA